ncbi:MAG: redoxin domain-containing protein [Phycisphaerales bacterium]|nr:redoxin domain-containing protein [Phycisphaerales bacterium]
MPLLLVLTAALALHSQSPSGAPAGDQYAASDRMPSPLAPPSPRDARALGIGTYIHDVQAPALDGSDRNWRTGRGDSLTVIALTSVRCPLCRKFGPSLARIEDAYANRGVKFVFVNVSGTDTTDEMRQQVADLGLDGLYVNDRNGCIAAALRAMTTTEVFVVDSSSTLVYRGAVSDQYGTNFTLQEPRRRLLEDALDAALEGRVPGIQATSAPGCAIEPPQAPGATIAGAADITYSRDIARIISASCVECHRTGGAGPFPLDSFEAVSRRASMIRAVTQEGTMPPWFAAPMPRSGSGPHSSPWSNDRSLSQAEKDAIAAWIAAGKPEGDPRDLPLPRAFAESEWAIGTPDAVFQLPTPIAIKADGVMPYEHVVVPTGLAEDRWVTAVQILPTDPSVVHHVLVFALDERTAQDPVMRRKLSADESRGYWAAYVPNNSALTLPPGMARRLPARSSLLFQIHYTPNGKATSDQMRLGVIFADAPPKRLVRTAAVADRRLRIPPGAKNHKEEASLRIPADARILAFVPHMHVRGTAYRYEIADADGSGRRTLLDIPKYDFNWQLRYELREPLDAPSGAVLHGTAWYDNSADNPANPDPTKTVRWGPQTTDEMMLGYIEYYLVNEDPLNPMDPQDRGGFRQRWRAGRR